MKTLRLILTLPFWPTRRIGWLILALNLSFIGAALTLPVGCQTPPSQRVVGTSLETVATSVHAAMNGYGVLYRAGKVSPADRERILAAYADYQRVATLALVALNYDASQPPGPQVALLAGQLLALIATLNR